MSLWSLDWPDAPPGVGMFSSGRTGGVSRGPYDDGAGGGGLNLGLHVGDDPADVMRNRAILRALLPAEPAWLSQVHGTEVLDASSVTGSVADSTMASDTGSASGAATDPLTGAPVADACIASRPGLVCAIQTADCLPVLLADYRGRVVGAAHAGWRGLAGGVLSNTVQRMRAEGAEDIRAWMGPAIGPNRFEVGADVLEAFAARDPATRDAFVPVQGKAGKYLADIFALATRALLAEGVSRIAGGGLCTMSDPIRFYSFRRDRITGRMASLIWIK